MKAAIFTRRTLLAAGVASASRPDFVSAQQTAAHELPDGLVGDFRPVVGGRRPAILVLGGSEGGLSNAAAGARLFAEQGFNGLGLAYFKAPGLPQLLEGVPLEYFVRALDWLAAQASVDPRRIGVLGGSRGAEAALLVASRDRRVKAVVAYHPTSVVFAGIDRAKGFDVGPSWTWRGQPLPAAKYDRSEPFTGVRDLFDRTLPQAPPETAIPVENINGPILMITGGKDEYWPAPQMAEAIAARLRRKRVRHDPVHLHYPEAGHSVFGPPNAVRPGQPPPTGLGAANQEARADSWPKVLDFFRRTLRA